jgi:hypothetical protein|tara:strand:+ start:475 stop:768 length:294 start_codon:yes stop_codon:yes gene_type:complete
MTVTEMLAEAAATFDQRSSVYGESYKSTGYVLDELFKGMAIELEGPDALNRFTILSIIVGKLNRYVANFNTGGHEDSLIDIAVYTQMLRELDQKESE